MLLQRISRLPRSNQSPSLALSRSIPRSGQRWPIGLREHLLPTPVKLRNVAMDQNFLARMHDATRLVGVGDLAAATDVIQSSLLQQGGVGQNSSVRGFQTRATLAGRRPLRSLGE